MSEAKQIADALAREQLTERELAELVRLYSNPGGFPYTVDVRNRPQGETIAQCSRIGSRLNRAMGGPYTYGMNVVGFCDGEKGTWRMRAVFAEALESCGLVKPIRKKVTENNDAEEHRTLVQRLEEQIEGDETISATEKRQLIAARLGQGRFRAAVQGYEQRCRVTGIEDVELLQASHIKPWAVAGNAERLHGANGLMLAPSMHLLFDKGYITFGECGTLRVSRNLPLEVTTAWTVKQQIEAVPFTREQLPYLRYHTAEIFRG
jgi:hypothetical protein